MGVQPEHVTAAPPHDAVDIYGMTDIGKVRRKNEDQFLIASMRKAMDVHQTSLEDELQQQLESLPRAYLLMIADGVGGSAGGERASETALREAALYITQTMECYYSVDEEQEEKFLDNLKGSVLRCQERILQETEQHPERGAMATTLTLVAVLFPRAYIIQVGDSRCYLFRNGQLTQLTKDQTVAQALVDQGILSESMAEDSRWSHVLSSALGADAIPVITTLEMNVTDALLLCTDGLTNHVTNRQIQERFAEGGTSEAICRSLVSLALNRGGTDNVTAIVGQATS